MVSRKRNITVMKVLFLITTFMLFLAGTINAGTIEVKQLGCGAEPDCYTTINSAIFYAQPDDTIKVYPGRYEEAVVIDKDLTLMGSGPQVTAIYSSANGITIGSYIKAKILGFTITSFGKNGVVLEGASNVELRNNIIVGNRMDGIYIKQCNAVLSSINNVISYNTGYGITAELGGYGQTCCSSLSVSANIINNNGKDGLLCRCVSETVSYNNVYANNYNQCPTPIESISQNPLFIDATNGNYTLQSTSPCKNAGLRGSADADPDGSRNDMGAYGGFDSAPFWPYPQGAPIITNLTVTPTSVQKGGTITINATGQVW